MKDLKEESKRYHRLRLKYDNCLVKFSVVKKVSRRHFSVV